MHYITECVNKNKILLSLLHCMMCLVFSGFLDYFPDMTNGSHIGLSCNPQSRLDGSGVRLIWMASSVLLFHRCSSVVLTLAAV